MFSIANGGIYTHLGRYGHMERLSILYEYMFLIRANNTHRQIINEELHCTVIGPVPLVVGFTDEEVSKNSAFVRRSSTGVALLQRLPSSAQHK